MPCILPVSQLVPARPNPPHRAMSVNCCPWGIVRTACRRKPKPLANRVDDAYHETWRQAAYIVTITELLVCALKASIPTPAKPAHNTIFSPSLAHQTDGLVSIMGSNTNCIFYRSSSRSHALLTYGKLRFRTATWHRCDPPVCLKFVGQARVM